MMFEIFYLLRLQVSLMIFSFRGKQGNLFSGFLSKYSGVTQLVMDWVNIQNLFFGHPKLVTNGIKQI